MKKYLVIFLVLKLVNAMMTCYLPFPEQLLVLEGYLLAAFTWALSFETKPKPNPKKNRQRGTETVSSEGSWNVESV